MDSYQPSLKLYVRGARSPGMRAPDDFLPLRPVEFEILLTLAEAERHGYAIIQETEARTGTRLETGTMYRALRRLVSDGLAKPTDRRATTDGDVEDERRRYYAITALGRQVASAEAARMARLVAAAKAVRLFPSPVKA